MKISPTVIIDTREQEPFNFEHLPAISGTLATGDYSVRHIESLVAGERKSLPDFLACVTSERDRFERELQRLRAYRFRLVVIECTYAELERGKWRSKVVPASVLGSLAAWTCRYELPIVCAGDHAQAGRFMERWLFHAAKAVAADAVKVAAFAADCIQIGRKPKIETGAPDLPEGA